MADKFGAEGAKVIISARRENRLQEAVKDLTDKGVDTRYKVCDVSNLEDVKALADYAWDEFGHVDVLVNNAGITGNPTMIVDATEENFQQVFNINVLGMLNGIWASRFVAQSAEKGAWPAVMCATEEGLKSEAYYGPTRRNELIGPIGECSLEEHALDQEAAAKLWTISEKKTSLSWSPQFDWERKE